MKKLTLLLLLSSSLTIGQQSKTIERGYPVKPGQRIEITGLSGSDITFRSWDKNEVSVRLILHISSSNDDYEREFVNRTDFQESSTASTLMLRFVEPRSPIDGGSFFDGITSFFKNSYVRKEISGEIFLPKDNALLANIPYATLSLEDMKGELRILGKSGTMSFRNCANITEVENDYGKITILNSGGNLRLNDKSGTIRIEDFDGRVDAEAAYSDVTVARVSKSVAVNSQSGKLRFDAVKGDLTVVARYSTITVNSVEGFADITSASGTVKVLQADGLAIDADYSTIDAGSISGKLGKPISLKGKSGKITLTDAVGNVAIENPYGNVTLRNIRGNIDLSTTSAHVVAENVTGNWNSQTSYSSLSLRQVTADNVTMINKSERITMELLSVPKRIDVKNEYGDVSLTMPPGFGGDASLEASYGTIKTDFPIKVKELGSGAYAIGKVGSGSGSIVIETKSGNIKIAQR